VVDSPGEEATGKDDQCVTISLEKPLIRCALKLLVQDILMEAVVDTRAVVSILRTCCMACWDVSPQSRFKFP
jgi:hypothetical protein